jgi:hypothetical protein
MDPSRIKRYPVTIDGETASIGTANELAVALDVLQGQYDRAVLEQLGPALAYITGGPLVPGGRAGPAACGHHPGGATPA